MKNIISSRTFWLAVAQAVVGGVAVIDKVHPTVGIILIVKSVIDVILRYLTTEPVTILPQS